MAENIGKVVVSIEAKVEALEQGLARAEAQMKRSADKLAAEQKTLGNKFKKSWTELSNKVGMYQMAVGAATKAVETLDEVTKLWGDNSKQTHDKIIGTFDAISNSGIPIIAEFSGLVQGLGSLFSDLDEVQASAAESARYLAEQESKVALAIELQKQIESLELQAQIQRGMLEVAKQREAGESGIALDYELQRKAMKEGFDIENKALETRLHQEGKLGRMVQDVLEQRKQKQRELLEVNREKEQFAHEQWKKQQDEKEAREEERLDRIEAIREAKEKAIADKTMSLQTKLNIMLAKQAGDEEKARTLAIEARYDAMKRGANEAQLAIINQMQAIEMASVGGGAVAETGGGGGRGGTSSISTALGSFTLAQRGAGDPVQKEHTKLLKSISDSSAVVAKQLNKPSAQGIVVAS